MFHTGVPGLYLVLLAGGGNDIPATRFHLSINTVTWAVRIAVFAVPAVVLVVTRANAWACGCATGNRWRTAGRPA
ncbi:hypothetical protein [Streptomyces griseoloalbus]|uniref:hypothetical protein n=1 Tax=Streptomyces griseoloalbus TaxID=67303 RepID=UPI003F5406FE